MSPMGNTVRCIAFFSVTILSILVIVLTILLIIFIQKYWSVYPEPQLVGLNFGINSTWNGDPVNHQMINISMTWNERNKAINIKYKAPLYLNPAPPNHTAGVVPGLWSYEVVEFFFANSLNQYVEIELGPMNHYLVLLLSGQRKSFNTGENLPLAVWNKLGNYTWDGEVDIPLAYLPPNISTFNAYNIHIENGTKIYEAYSPAIGNFTSPDFHRLQFFAPLDPSAIIPSAYFSETHSFLGDTRYPDLWHVLNTALILLLISVTSSTWVSAKYKADIYTDDDVIAFHNTTECGRWTAAPCRNDIYGTMAGFDEQFYRQIYFLFRHDCGVTEPGMWRWKRIDLTSPDGKRRCSMLRGVCKIEEIFVNLDDD